MSVSQLLGFTGTLLIIAAYVPQVSHLIKEHCSAGISLRAYKLWLVASLLLLSHAIMIHDVVFIVLQSTNLMLTAIIYLYARRYTGGICQSHALTGSAISQNSRI